MRPEDWQKGMENEAASVGDREWARATRRVARRQRVWRSAWQLLLSLAAAEALILLCNAVTVQQTWSAVQSRPWFTTEPEWWVFSLSLMLVLTLCLGALLGFSQVIPKLALPAFLAFPILQVFTGMMVPGPGRPFPGSPLEALDLYPRFDWGEALGLYLVPWGWAQLLTITVGISVGIRLGARRRLGRPRSI